MTEVCSSATEEIKETMENGWTAIMLYGNYRETADEIAKGFVVEVLPRYPHCKIVRIDFGTLVITDEGAKELGNAIPLIPTLEELELTHGNIGAIGVEALAKGASQSHSLGVINLSYNKCKGVDGIKAFSEYVPPSLRKLWLIDCGIGDEGMQFVATLLLKTHTLQELNVGANGITDTEPIAGALMANSSLQTICLNENKINNRGIRGLAKVLFHNTHMDTLDLIDNDLTDEGDDNAKDCLMVALSHNRTVTSVDIAQNYMSHDAATEIAEFATHIQERQQRMRHRLSVVLLEFAHCPSGQKSKRAKTALHS